MKQNRFFASLRMTVVLAVLLFATAALAQSTSATFPVEVTFQGLMNGGKYAYMINSNLGKTYNSGVQDLKEGDCVYIDQEFDIGSADVPLTMTINGAFTFGTSSGDATATISSAFFAFTSGSKYITGVSVSTYSGTPVSFNNIEATNFYREFYLPVDTSFGKVTLTMATHTPLDYGATIGSIEDTYLDDGVNQPVPTVTYQEGSSPAITLTEGVDYTVSYNVGRTSGTVTVTGMGQYIGTKSKSYNIRQLQLSDFTQLGDGSYEIASTDELDRLSKFVSNGNNCSGVTFRQTADIAYTYASECTWDNQIAATISDNENFTPIGRYGQPFKGHFDGQGHTISGIRVFQALSNDNHDNESIGLFGFVSDGSVSNVVLRDANIVGELNVGGIVGYLSGGSATSCTLYHVRTATSATNASASTRHTGVVVGCQGGTVSSNHYRDCCVGTITYNMETHIPTPINTRADNVFALTLGTDVTASKTSGESVTIDATTYYTEGSTFTLGYSGTAPTGYTFSGYSATAGTIDGSTLTMPDTDVTVSATIIRCSLALSQGVKDGVTAWWGTFYDGTNRFTLPEGAAAYTMGTDYKLYRLGTDGRTIPAGVAVVIIATSADVTLTLDGGSSVVTDHAPGGNQLLGSDSAVALDGSGKVPVPGSSPATTGTPYVLSVSGTPAAIDFRQFTGASIPAGKAYYEVIP